MSSRRSGGPSSRRCSSILAFIFVWGRRDWMHAMRGIRPHLPKSRSAHFSDTTCLKKSHVENATMNTWNGLDIDPTAQSSHYLNGHGTQLDSVRNATLHCCLFSPCRRAFPVNRWAVLRITQCRWAHDDRVEYLWISSFVVESWYNKFWNVSH